MACSFSYFDNIFWRIYPCRSALPFWKWASVLMVVMCMLWACAKLVTSSELSSVPASTTTSWGVPAHISQDCRKHSRKASAVRDGATHATWKLVALSTKWYTWNPFPCALVHENPSTWIRSLKSSSSRKLPCGPCLGTFWAWQTEHFISSAARATSGRNPCWRMMLLNFSAWGWPRFLCARMSACCSSLVILRKWADWVGDSASACWDSVSIGLGLVWSSAWECFDSSVFGVSTVGEVCELSGGCVVASIRDVSTAIGNFGIASENCHIQAARVWRSNQLSVWQLFPCFPSFLGFDFSRLSICENTSSIWCLSFHQGFGGSDSPIRPTAHYYFPDYLTLHKCLDFT